MTKQKQKQKVTQKQVATQIVKVVIPPETIKKRKKRKKKTKTTQPAYNKSQPQPYQIPLYTPPFPVTFPRQKEDNSIKVSNLLRNYVGVQQKELQRLRGDLVAYRQEAQTAMRQKVAFPKQRVNLAEDFVEEVEEDVEEAEQPVEPREPFGAPTMTPAVEQVRGGAAAEEPMAEEPMGEPTGRKLNAGKLMKRMQESGVPVDRIQDAAGTGRGKVERLRELANEFGVDIFEYK